MSRNFLSAHDLHSRPSILPHSLVVFYKFIALSIVSLLMTPKSRPSIQTFPWTSISRDLFALPTGYLIPKVYSELWVPPHPQLYLTHPTFVSLSFHWAPTLQTWNNFDPPTGFTLNLSIILLSPSSDIPGIQLFLTTFSHCQIYFYYLSVSHLSSLLASKIHENGALSFLLLLNSSGQNSDWHIVGIQSIFSQLMTYSNFSHITKP